MLFKMWHALRRAGGSLPDEVTSVISAASITWRGYDEDSGPRVIVALGGPLRGAFVYSDEEAASRIEKRWPWLNPDQVRRATNYLGARVRVECTEKKQRIKKNWVLDY